MSGNIRHSAQRPAKNERRVCPGETDVVTLLIGALHMGHRSSMSTVLFFALILICTNTSPAHSQEATGLAVLDFDAIGVSEIEARALSEKLRTAISQMIINKDRNLKDTYNLVERSQMDKIFEQFEIQDTGCTDLSCALEFGRILDVGKIVIGSISLVGRTYIIAARIIDVESGVIQKSVDRQQKGAIDDIINLMPLVGRDLLTGERLGAPVPVAESPVPRREERVKHDSPLDHRHRIGGGVVHGMPSGNNEHIYSNGIGISTSYFYNLNRIVSFGPSLTWLGSFVDQEQKERGNWNGYEKQSYLDFDIIVKISYKYAYLFLGTGISIIKYDRKVYYSDYPTYLGERTHEELNGKAGFGLNFYFSNDTSVFIESTYTNTEQMEFLLNQLGFAFNF